MRASRPSVVQHALQRLLVAAVLFVLSACGGGDGKPSTTFVGSPIALAIEFCNSPWIQPGPNCDGILAQPLPLCIGDATGIIDGCGAAITSPIDLHDPVAMTVTGLTANTRHTIIISDTDTPPTVITPAGGLIAVSDDDGSINKVTIVQNMLPGAFLGDYSVTIDEEGGGSAPQVLSYTVADLSRVQCVDVAGVPKASFLASDTVYAKVDQNSGVVADGDYNVYVLSDAQKALADGGPISGTPMTVTIAAGTGSVELGSYAVGGYDVVVDINGNAVFNQGTDLISRHNRLMPCFAVQAANTGAAQQIAADKNGNRREIFDPNANIVAIRDIQAFLVPSELSAVSQPGEVETYIVNHQATWSDLDPLVDISGGAKVSPVQNESNSEAPWVLVPFAGLASLGGTTCYDVVIDTNRNGVYDVGTDYVDNIDSLGVNSCGVRVSTASCASNVDITVTDSAEVVLVNGGATTDTAIQLAGSILGSPAMASVTITSGEQSNTIGLALDDGDYDSPVPLFAGDNDITVSGVYLDNSSCSQTITIRSVVDLALFRAQLTWDGSGDTGFDMDLHLVRPGGSYSNGGGGEDDCNWINCKVGLDGLGTNSIDWGAVGDENDDPKLDVDCIDDCRIENIWMNQLSEEGVYKVYVDAFLGSGADVTVSISILGTTVAQVICGSMTSDTATDSCYVGDITWVGGIGGTGDFTPVGTRATDF